MERIANDMSSLFAQLGQANDAAAICRFIALNGPMGDGVQLHEGAFWTASQASFLREAIQDDAEWAEVVDTLNAELHKRGRTTGGH